MSKVVRFYIRDVDGCKVYSFVTFEEMFAWVKARANEY